MTILNGTGVVKIPWLIKSANRIVSRGKFGAKRERQITFDSFDYVRQNIVRFKYDTSALDIEDAAWVASEISVSPFIAKNQEMRGHWQNVDEAIKRKTRSKNHFCFWIW